MRHPLLLAGLVLTSHHALSSPSALAAVPDGLPLLEWEGRHLPDLPDAWRPLSETALTAARAWAGETGLGTWDPALAARSTTAFHVMGWALPRTPGLPPEPAVTGWWTADPAQAAAAAPLVDRWPGQRAMLLGDRLSLTHPRTPEVGETVVDGMRVRLRGEALTACLKPLVDNRKAWEPVLTAVAGWRLEASLGPDGMCRMDTGIPLRHLGPVDPAAVERLPAALLTVALGIAPTADPTVLPGGTWALSWNGDDHLMVAIPDGDQVRTWLRGWIEQTPDRTGAVEALGDQGPWLQREALGWRLAFVREDLDAPVRKMPAAGPRPARPGQLQWMASGSASTSTVPGLGNLLGTGTQEVLFHDDKAGTAIIQTRDPAVAWLLPALALRWFADEVSDQHGMAKLRGVLARLKTAGIPVTREELQATQPAVTDAAGWLERAKAWDHPVAAPDASAVGEGLASSRLPLGVATPEELQAARAFAAKIAPMLALPPEQIAAIPWQGAPPSVAPAALVLPFLSLQRKAAKSGMLLVQHGDARGLPLVDAARTSLGRPGTLIESLVLLSVHALRDQTWLTATVQGLGDPTAWIAEPYRVEEEGRTAWAGERIMTGWIAHVWLGEPQRTTPAWPQGNSWLGRHPLVFPGDRAGIASDLADLLEQLANAHGQVPILDPARLRSHLLRNISPATEIIRTNLTLGRIHHHLARLAGAIVLQARRQPLPKDPADLGLALSVPGPTGPLPCTWQRLDGTSFRLALDVRGPVPPGIPAQRWAQWQQGTLPEAAATLAHSANPPLVQVHQSAAPRTPGVNF